MNKNKFIKSIGYLHAAYPQTFKLDIKDSYSIDVWYDLLKGFDDNQFVDTLKDYAKHNQFAPNSPASLIEWEKERIMKNLDSGDTFEKLIKRIRDNAYELDKVILKYQNGGLTVVAKSIKELYSDFTLWFNDSSQLGFLKNKFLKVYAQNVMNDIDKNIGNSQYSVGNETQLKLGE